MNADSTNRQQRRDFLKKMFAYGGATLIAGSLGEALAQTAPDWTKQIGLELFTVRDAMQTDFEGVLAKIASFGYKEVEPASGYNNMSPKEFRAMLDRYGLSMPSTHSGLPAGDTIEARLEGGQVMGLQYVENLGGGGAAGRTRRRAGNSEWRTACRAGRRGSRARARRTRTRRGTERGDCEAAGPDAERKR